MDFWEISADYGGMLKETSRQIIVQKSIQESANSHG